MIVSASVLFPEPFGPMIAWTSPARTTRSMPFRISLPSTCTWRSLISRSDTLRLLQRWARSARQRLERHRIERLRDVVLHGHPHVVRRAARLKRAVLYGRALRGADLRLDGSLERSDDVARGDLPRLARKRVAPTRAALALHQAGLTQARDQLL